MNSKITIPFSFKRSDPQIFVATNGQKFMDDLLSITPENPAFNNVGFVLTDLEGLNLDRLVSVASDMLSQNHSLRTVFRKQNGCLMQEVLEVGSLSLDLWETDSHTRNDLLADLFKHLLTQPFAMDDFPTRLGCISRNGIISDVVLVFSHMVIDGGAIPVLQGQLLSAIETGADYPQEAQNARQPIEHAIWEQSEAGRRMTGRAASYWRESLSKFPTRLFDFDADEEQHPKWQQLNFHSTDMERCIGVLASAHRVSHTTVILTVLLRAMERYAAKGCVATAICTSNRFHPFIEESIGTYAQDVPFMLSFADQDLQTSLYAMQDILYKGYQYGISDPKEIGSIAWPDNAICPGILDSRININYHKGISFQQIPQTSLKKIAASIVDKKNMYGLESSFSWTDGVPHVGKAFYAMSYSPRKLLLLCNFNYLRKAKIEEMMYLLENDLVEGILDILR